MELDASRAASTGPAPRQYPDCYPLIIEDDPSYAKLLVEAFKRTGVPEENVRVAGDGEQAVSTLASSVRAGAESPSSRVPTVVVLDLWLRRRSGLSVLAWMKSEAALAPLPVVILTGTERARDMAEARKLAADSFYVKPFCFGDLVKLAAEIASRPQALCEAPSP
jgi:DNA-binding response OmpR family regulator